MDVPDIQALRALWPELKSVWMGAGPVPGILHRALNVLAWMVRARLLPSLSPFAGLMYRAINVLRWGEHRGGMFVAARRRGRRPAARSRGRGTCLAEGDDGPLIPSMAAAALIRRCLEGRPPAPGARPAVRDLELDDYERLFEARTIYAGIREPVPADAPLYRRMLGDAWAALPEPIRAMHDLTADRTAKGIATVERGTGLLARIIAALFRFPKAGRDVPLTVHFQVRDGRETWRRNFAGHAFASRQAQGRGRFDGLLRESFGPFAFGLALVLENGRLRLVPRRWTAFGIPMPLALAPGGDAYEVGRRRAFPFQRRDRPPVHGTDRDLSRLARIGVLAATARAPAARGRASTSRATGTTSRADSSTAPRPAPRRLRRRAR